MIRTKNLIEISGHGSIGYIYSFKINKSLIMLHSFKSVSMIVSRIQYCKKKKSRKFNIVKIMKLSYNNSYMFYYVFGINT